MSATLGPIHHWLYRKIQIQQMIVSELLVYARNKYSESTKLNEFVIPWRSDLPLESMIDVSNIHGWLQSEIHLVEKTLATLIAEILVINGNSMDMMKSIFEDVGKKVSKVDITSTILEIYREIHDCLLDGMPCDRVNIIINQTENEVVWQRKICLHEDDYTAVGLDVSVYYELRDALIRGLIFSGDVMYEVQSDFTYRLRPKLSAIECMMQEHRNIERMLKVIRNACYEILQGCDICYEDFTDMIDFIRNYADNHHHGKEEDVLFLKMKQHLGFMGENLITHGMLVEHDLGRLYIKGLEIALKRVQTGDEMSKIDIISNANGYASLLSRHIAKEDEVVYPFGVKKLDNAVMNEIESKCRAKENAASTHSLQDTYLNLLTRLEAKYCKL